MRGFLTQGNRLAVSPGFRGPTAFPEATILTLALSPLAQIHSPHLNSPQQSDQGL